MDKELKEGKEAIEAEIIIYATAEQAYAASKKYQDAANCKQERKGLEKALILLDPISRKKWKP